MRWPHYQIIRDILTDGQKNERSLLQGGPDIEMVAM